MVKKGKKDAGPTRKSFWDLYSVCREQLGPRRSLLRKVPPSRGFAIDFTFGAHRLKKIDFLQAAKLVEGYTLAEHKACLRQVEIINRDQWFASFWSEVLGGVKPPTHQQWMWPRILLGSARAAFRRGNKTFAITKFRQAVSAFNSVHKKWMKYQQGLQKGGARSITTIEITIIVLSTVVSVGAGARLAGKSVQVLGRTMAMPAKGAALKMAATSAGLSAYTGTAKGAGLVGYGVEKEIDVAKIALDAGTAFVTSLVGGKLSEKFLGLLAPKVAAALTHDKVVVEAARRAGLLLPNSYSVSQKLLADFVGGAGTNIVAEAVKRAVIKAKGKKITMLGMIQLVTEEIGKESLATALKAYIASKAK